MNSVCFSLINAEMVTKLNRRALWLWCIALLSLKGSFTSASSTLSPSFKSPASYIVNDAFNRIPISVAVGDVNNDGNLDIITTNAGETGSTSLAAHSVVTFLFGDRTGKFSRQTITLDLGTVFRPTSVIGGDLNRDGNFDLVTSQEGDSLGLKVFLGDGRGNFGVPSRYRIGASPYPLAALLADVNGDGILDILTANRLDDTVSVLTGRGDGSFIEPFSPSPGPYRVGSYPRAIACADFDRDGHIDIVSADYEASSVSVLFGMSGGSFAAAAHFKVGKYPQSVKVADLDLDGKPDIITQSQVDSTVTILFSTGRNFRSPISYPVQSQPVSVAAADANGDGILDLVTFSPTSGFSPSSVAICVGDGAGHFLPPVTFALAADGAGTGAFSLGDFNRDGLVDIASTNFAGSPGGSVSVLLNSTIIQLSPLSIRRKDKLVELAWPSSFTGFAVEITDKLTPPAWVRINGVVRVVGNENVTSLNPTNPSAFYRLTNR